MIIPCSKKPSEHVSPGVLSQRSVIRITYRRWGQSTSYNVAHPACGQKGSTHLSPVRAYEFLSRCRFSTPTPRQPMVKPFVLASSRFPLRKPEEKSIPAESRTHKFRLSGRMLYPLLHGGSLWDGGCLNTYHQGAWNVHKRGCGSVE